MLYQLNCSHFEKLDGDTRARNPSWSNKYQGMALTVNGRYTDARIAACRWISRNDTGKGGEVKIIAGGKERSETIFRFNRNYQVESLRGRYGQRYSVDKRTKQISLVDQRTGKLVKIVDTWEK